MQSTLFAFLALAIAAPAARSQGCIPPPPDLVGWWDADDTYVAPNGGVWATNIVNRISAPPLAWASAITSAPGHTGLGFSFGSGSWAQVPHHPTFDFTSQMSIELWIQCGAQPAGPAFELLDMAAFGDSGFMLYGAPSTGELTFRVGHGSALWTAVDTVSAVDTGAWRHIVATFDASLSADNLKIYVDGVIDAMATTPSGALIQTNALGMAVGRDFVGVLDGVSLYSRALDATEVGQLHQASGKCSDSFPARPTPSGTLVSSDPSSYFGGTLSVDGDTLAIGQSGANLGYPWSLEVWRRIAGVWTPSESISNPLLSSLGTATTSLSGDVLAAGFGSASTINGAIVIFRFDGSSWVHEYTDAEPLSGESVAVSGDFAILGRSGENACCGTSSFVKIYRYDGSAWSVDAQLFAPTAGTNPRFGVSVDIGDDLAVVGAHLDDGPDGDSGALYVYRRILGVWTLTQTITPDMVEPGAASYTNWWFGRQVDLDGERVLVSAPGSIFSDTVNTIRGTAYVIDLSGGGIVVEGELTPSLLANGFGDDGAGFSAHGRLVHLDGDRAVVGTPGDAGELYSPGGTGAVYVFARKNDTWTEVGKCMAGFGSQLYLGTSAVLAGDTVIAGAGGGATAYLFDGFEFAQFPTTYCIATTFNGAGGVTTNGCTPDLTASGTPSVSETSGFWLVADDVEGNKFGIVFYGLSGRKSSPWAPGSLSVLCVKSPVQRTPSQNSLGAPGTCEGVLQLDWLEFLATHPSALGQPFGSGVTVNAQAWFRDPPAPGTTNLSNAIEFVTLP